MKIFDNLLRTNQGKKLMSDALSSHFRILSSKESFHTNVFDFRDIEDGNPNNKILITCEHATNNFHQYQNQLSKSDKQFLETHWAYDIGAKDISLDIAEEIRALLICTNFSRLILDPNRGILSNTLIRENVEVDVELDVNKNANREERINLFYVPYYNTLYEVLHFLKPEYFLSMHSFTPYYEKEKKRDFHIGILYKEENELTKQLEKTFKENGVFYRVNEPYNMNDGELFAFDALTNYSFPKKCKGCLLEIRNDLALEDDYKNFITPKIAEAVKLVEKL